MLRMRKRHSAVNLNLFQVVLTVRDNEHVWYESWINFFEQNFKGIAVNIATHLAWHGFFGKEIYEMVRVGK
jgi:hypothetical protein